MSKRGFISSRQAERTLLLVCIGVAVGLLSMPDAAQVRVADALGAFTTEPVMRLRAFIREVGRVRRENGELRARVAELELERIGAARLRRDADRLRQAAGLAAASLGALQPCDVIAYRAGRLPSLIKIRSPRPLVWEPYQAVLAPTGLIGRVRQPVGSFEAWVELIASPDVAIGCEIESSGILGILRANDGEFRLEMVARDAQIVVGDRVLTSGIAEVRDAGPGGRAEAGFPPGLPVGVVTEVAAPPDQIFKVIRVRPLASLTQNEVVFVVTRPGAWYLPALSPEVSDSARAVADTAGAVAGAERGAP